MRRAAAAAVLALATVGVTVGASTTAVAAGCQTVHKMVLPVVGGEVVEVSAWVTYCPRETTVDTVWVGKPVGRFPQPRLTGRINTRVEVWRYQGGRLVRSTTTGSLPASRSRAVYVGADVPALPGWDGQVRVTIVNCGEARTVPVFV